MSVGYVNYKGSAILTQGYTGTDGETNLSLSGKVVHPIEVRREHFTNGYKMLFYVPSTGNFLGENFANYVMSSTIEILIRTAEPAPIYSKWFSYSLTEVDPMLGFTVTMDPEDVFINLNEISTAHKKITIELRGLTSWIPVDKVTLDEIALDTQIYEISSRIEFAKIIV